MSSGSSRSAGSRAMLVTIGACATAGGIQALRNGRDVDGFASIVYAHPEFIDTLATSTPIADHVPVDLELRGCPIDRAQLLRDAGGVAQPARAAAADDQRVCHLQGARPDVCDGGPRRTVPRPGDADGMRRIVPVVPPGCYGCFGPMESPNCRRSGGQLTAAGSPRRRCRSAAPHVQHGSRSDGRLRPVRSRRGGGRR